MALLGLEKGKEELKGAEVLELTKFAEKKAWIDSKIAFLSSLPPIVVASPDPPGRSEVSTEQLDEWWKEHDRIEDEVGEYDMGDLAKMRSLAREKSKQALSPRDTDLIEITLTTLFAVDKLLHLLRNRRKALSLLGYRLQWEDALAKGWQSHHHLIEDLLPAFLTSARWTIPAAVSSPSRHPSDDPVATLSASTASLSASASSLSLSTSSRRISSLGSSASASASATTRTIRQQMLSLSLDQLTSHSRTLRSNQLPMTATLLDKLIDTSPTPLPDSFLDEQDRIEADIGRTKEVESFAAEMAKQWKGADEVFWRSCELEKEAEKLAKEADEAVSALSSMSLANAANGAHIAADPTTFASRLSTLYTSLLTLGTSLSALPSPSHPLAPTQLTSDTPRLFATLRKNIDRATATVGNAEEKVKRWEKAKKAVEEAEGVKAELERVQGVLHAVKGGLERISGDEVVPPSPEDGTACLAPRTAQEERWEQRWDAAFSPALPLISASHGLLRRAAESLSTLSSRGSPPVAPSLRRSVRELAHAVRAEVDAMKVTTEGADRRRMVVEAAREAEKAAVRARELIRERTEDVAKRVQEARWMAGETVQEKEASAPILPDDLVKPVRDAVETALSAPFKAAEDLLASSASSLPLLDHLRSLHTSVRADDLAALSSLACVFASVRGQASAVRSFARQAASLDDRIRALSERADAELRGDSGSWDAGERDAIRAELSGTGSDGLSAEVDRLVEDCARNVPFVANTAIAKVPFDFSLVDLDTSIRNFVNTTTARLQGQLDDAVERLTLLDHDVEARKWDEKAARSEELVCKIEEEVKKGRRRIDERQDDDEATLSPLLAHLSSLDLISSGTSLEQLSSSFAHLLASPASSSAPFHAHAARRSQLDALSSRLEAARAAANNAEKVVQEARRARETKVEVWVKERNVLVEQLKAKEEQFDAVVAEAGELDTKISTARKRRVQEQEQLMQREDVDLEADVAIPELAQATTALTSLRLRFDTAQAGFDTLTSTLQSLECSLPPPDSSATTLFAASTAQSSGLSACSAASTVLSQAEQSLSSLTTDSKVWRARREAEVERRRHAAEEASAAAAIAAGRLEVQDSDPVPRQTLCRSQALPALAIVEPDQEEDPFASPSDPFALQPSLQEPAEVQRLREQVAAITAQEWLESATVLQLPSVADAAEVRRQVNDSRLELEAFETGSPDLLVWTDVDGLKQQLDDKDQALKRVSLLADFRAKVDIADAALSNLLDSIDAVAPDLVPPPSYDPCPILPLPQAMKRTGEAVSDVRSSSQRLIYDTRVTSAVRRIEETWHEMLSMTEAARSTSSASSISMASHPPSPKPSTSDDRSSRASSRTSTRTPSTRGPSRLSLQASSLRSSTRSNARPSSAASRTASRLSSHPSAESAPLVPPRPGSAALLSPQTPRKKRDEEDTFATPTPRRRAKSGLPVPSTDRRSISSLPRAPPTVVRPFSFHTPAKRDLAMSTSSIPRRITPSPSRRGSIASVSSLNSLFSPPMQRIASASTTSSRRDSLASTITSSPRPKMPHSTPPRRTQPYRPKDNKLDRAVGDIVNSLSIHVPITVADGKWTDDSGVYLIGGRLVFCRILRSKQVMCRTGGGWENLLSFVVSHFGTAAGLTISPSTSLKKNLSSATEPEWISSQAVRDQLAASQSSASLRDYLSSSVSSSLANTDLSLSTSSFSLRRSVSGSASTPDRRSIGGAAPFNTFSPSSTTAAPKSRPPLPIWRP
ncbi:hypothetical protein JCM11251_000457 [Rhodosporidiobolus azoricus]